MTEHEKEGARRQPPRHPDWIQARIFALADAIADHTQDGVPVSPRHALLIHEWAHELIQLTRQLSEEKNGGPCASAAEVRG